MNGLNIKEEFWLYDIHFDMIYHLLKLRYKENNGWFNCPKCMEWSKYHVKEGRYNSFYCNTCRKSITGLDGTPFRNSRIPISIFAISYFLDKNIVNFNHKKMMT